MFTMYFVIFSLEQRTKQKIHIHVKKSNYRTVTATTKVLSSSHVNELYVVGSKSFRPDKLFKVKEIKQLCYFST